MRCMQGEGWYGNGSRMDERPGSALCALTKACSIHFESLTSALSTSTKDACMRRRYDRLALVFNRATSWPGISCGKRARHVVVA